MEQPGVVMMRLEKVIDANNEYEEFQQTKDEGRRKLKHGS